MKRHFKTLAMVMTCVAMALCVSCKKDNEEPTGGGTGITVDSDGTIVDREYVDLGLPSGLLWATCNVGAIFPWGYGGYFAWGETEAKDRYNWVTYKWYNIDSDNFTKYCTVPGYGTVDNKTVLDPEDDVAHVNWGGGWRMPTIDEMEELKNCCKWEWTTLLLSKGYRVTGPNGKCIFLPAGGWYEKGNLMHVGIEGYYWSRSLNTDNPNKAHGLDFYSRTVYLGNYHRIDGHSVRPVCNPQQNKTDNF